MESKIKAIAVTGTPGCGKTTLCSKLAYPVISVHELAEEYECIDEVDVDGAAPIDIEKLSQSWVKPTELTLIDGHLSHLLPVDAIIILRCNPKVLKERLQSRGYSKIKVDQNVEIEMMGGPWPDILDDKRPKIESDSGIKEWIESGCPDVTSPFDAVDWISKI